VPGRGKFQLHGTVSFSCCPDCIVCLCGFVAACGWCCRQSILSLSLTLSSWAMVASGMSSLLSLLSHGDTVGIVCGQTHCGVHAIIIGGEVSGESLLGMLSPSLSSLYLCSFMMALVLSVSLVFS